MSKREQTSCSSSANECPAGIYAKGILLDAPDLIKSVAWGGIFYFHIVLGGCFFYNTYYEKHT